MPRKFRGQEHYDTTRGTSLHIVKNAPGSEEGEGYTVEITIDGEPKDSIQVSSKRKIDEIINTYKAYYGTDKAFLNEMSIFITYKNTRGVSVKKDIDSQLEDKLAELETMLNATLFPESPMIVKHAEEVQSKDLVSTDDIIAEAKRVISEYIKSHSDKINESGDALDGESKSLLHNDLTKWVYDFKTVLDKEIEGGAPIDKEAIISALESEFGKHDFISNGESKAASVMYKEAIDISTDEKVRQLVDSLNFESRVSKDDANMVQNNIGDKLDGTGILPHMIAAKLEELRASFYNYIQRNKVTADFDDAFIEWADSICLGVKESSIVYSDILHDITIQSEKFADTYEFFKKMTNLAKASGVNLVEMLSYYPGEGYDQEFLSGIADAAVNLTLYDIFYNATEAEMYDFNTLAGLQKVRDVNRRAMNGINHFITTTTPASVYEDAEFPRQFTNSEGNTISIDPASLQFISGPINSIIPNLQADELYVYRIAKSVAAQGY